MTALVFGSRLPVGSSARMTFGPFMSARAMATRCCSPPESSPGRWRRRSARPTSASATTSPARISTEAPRSTRTTSGPVRYSRSTSTPASRGGLLVAEDIHGRQRARASRGDDGGQEGQEQGGAHDQDEVGGRQLHRQIVDLVDVAGELDDLVGVL